MPYSGNHIGFHRQYETEQIAITLSGEKGSVNIPKKWLKDLHPTIENKVDITRLDPLHFYIGLKRKDIKYREESFQWKYLDFYIGKIQTANIEERKTLHKIIRDIIIGYSLRGPHVKMEMKKDNLKNHLEKMNINNSSESTIYLNICNDVNEVKSMIGGNISVKPEVISYQFDLIQESLYDITPRCMESLNEMLDLYHTFITNIDVGNGTDELHSNLIQMEEATTKKYGIIEDLSAYALNRIWEPSTLERIEYILIINACGNIASEMEQIVRTTKEFFKYTTGTNKNKNNVIEFQKRIHQSIINDFEMLIPHWNTLLEIYLKNNIDDVNKIQTASNFIFSATEKLDECACSNIEDTLSEDILKIKPILETKKCLELVLCQYRIQQNIEGILYLFKRMARYYIWLNISQENPRSAREVDNLN